MWTRREFAALLCLPTLRGQGVSTRNVAPTSRGKPSGLPFNARFTDIAEAAGLRAPVICGGVERKAYILETVGCRAAFIDVTKQAGLLHDGVRWGSGCTFLDYDRNGLLDLFVANYLEFDANAVPKPGSSAYCTWKGVPVICGPRGLPPGSGVLYRNNGD